MPPQPTDCRDALHWFVDNYGLYTGSVRGLFISDFREDQEPYLESTMISLRSRGVEPFVITGEHLYAQAEQLFNQAVGNTPFGQPTVSTLELDLLGAEVAVLKDLEAPINPHHLWYLYHYVVFPRTLFNKATIVTTHLGVDEFIAYGSECEDLEFAGNRASWDRLTWLLDATLIDLHQFRQVRTEGLPPMLKGEYNLFNAIKERGLPVVAQQVLGDYALDIALTERDNRVAIEIDSLVSIDSSSPSNNEAKKNLVLLSDGWKIIRFTTSEILGDLTLCVDAVEQVWSQGRKKAAIGRLLSGRAQASVPELPEDDEVQRMAITHHAGPLAITGGAGTGKSSCIAHRVGYLLSQGVSPERILVLSHSAETVKQIKRSIEVLTDSQTVQRLSISDWKDVGFKVLKENASSVDRKAPLKEEQNPHRVLQRALKKVRKDLDPVKLELLEQEIDELTLFSLISLFKANMISPKQVQERGKTDEDQLVANVYQTYEDALKKSNRVDPDDMVSLCAQLLAKDTAIRERYQNKYEFVLVDEYQDCNASQDLMCRLLAFPQDNLLLVGNEDECVNESKGSLPHMLSEVSIRMPNARCYVLEKNWRSHPAIVEHSKNLRSAMQRTMIRKDVAPGRPKASTSAIIGPHKCKDEIDECDWIANEVSIIIDSGKMPSDIVLLWRHQRYASLLEEALFRKNIRSMTSGLLSEALPDEVGDVMAFLRLVMDPDGPKARQAFERFCQLKSREMDQKLSKLSNTIASFAEANNLSFLKAIEIYHDATADSSCEDLAQLVRIVRTMNQEKLPPAQTIGLLKRTQKLHEIYSSVKVPAGVIYEPMRKVEQLEEEAKEYKTVEEFLKAKEELTKPSEASTENSAVHVKGFEEAKGCEYRVVFLAGMAEGICPDEAALDIEEERRLCYVAMSRAREYLYLSYPQKFEGNSLAPSPFLVEARLMPSNIYQRAVEMIKAELPVPQEAKEAPIPEVVQPPVQVEVNPAAAASQAGPGASEHLREQPGQTTQVPPATQGLQQLPPAVEARGQGQEEQLRAQYDAYMQAQQAAQQRQAEQEQRRLAQEAHLRVLHEQRLREQQLEQQRLEQEARLRAQQEAQQRAEEQARLKARQEEERRLAEEARLQAEQEARQRAEEEQRRLAEEVRLRAEQEARQKAEAEQIRLAEEARLRAEAEAEAKRQAAAEAEEKRIAEETRQREEAEAKKKALAEIEEKRLADEARIKADQEARASVEAQLAAAQRGFAQPQVPPETVESPDPEPVSREERAQQLKLAQEAQARKEIEERLKSAGVSIPQTGDHDLQKVLDEQFSIGGKKPPEEVAEPQIVEEVSKSDSPPSKDEEMVRSNQQILSGLTPEEREKQQELLRKKARERMKAKGQKKAKEQSDASEPSKEEVPAAPSFASIETPSAKDEGMGSGGPIETDQMPNDETAVPEPVLTAEPTPLEGYKEEYQQAVDSLFDSGTSSGVMVHRPGQSAPAIPDGNFLSQISASETQYSDPNVSVPQSGESEPPSGGFNAYGIPIESSEPQSMESMIEQTGPVDGDVEVPLQAEPIVTETDPALVGESPSPAGAWAVPSELPSQGAFSTPPLQPPPPAPARPVVQPGSTVPFCPQCAAPLEASARFCGECGLQMEARIPPCPGCGVPVEPQAKFCGECGFGLQRA